MEIYPIDKIIKRNAINNYSNTMFISYLAPSYTVHYLSISSQHEITCEPDIKVPWVQIQYLSLSQPSPFRCADSDIGIEPQTREKREKWKSNNTQTQIPTKTRLVILIACMHACPMHTKRKIEVA
jgi:hypothetical protein